MKPHLSIGLMFGLALLAACTSTTTKVPEPVEGPSPELCAIDSLMWRQPDSALAVLMNYLNDDGRDAARHVSTDETFDNHYANLLLAELLYKNYCEQTNRSELSQAVSYFDSLTSTLNDHPHASWRHGGLEPPSPERNDNLFFLDARAHYINGVGYYENDSMVEACREYLKALEVMEEQFEEKELVGKKAKFMTYTYNRLGDMFSEQFMMESAISCYKNSYLFSLVSPVSSYSISNALYRIGKQFNMKGDIDSANFYYLQAIANMPDSTSLLYRDIISNQTLLSYQVTHQSESSIQRLKQMLLLADDDDEKSTRYLIIGDIYFEEKQYDSALFYLESVFKNKDDAVSQMQAAEYLRILYDSLGEKEKSDSYIHFLAIHKPMEHDADAKISKLSKMFQNYVEEKQRQQSEKEKHEERRQAIKKTIGILFPISLFVVTVFILVIRKKHKESILAKEMEANRKMKEEYQRHKKEIDRIQEEAYNALEETDRQHEEELKKQQIEAKQKMEAENKRHTEAIGTERHTHKMQQAALSSRLKRSNEELRELKDQMKLQKENLRKKDEMQAASFVDEPICRLIMERVNEGQFLSQMDCTIYKDFALDKDQLSALRKAADLHYNQFTMRISKDHPELTRSDLDYCCLYLLSLTDADIAALMQRAYNTINERNSKLRKIFGSENAISITLQAIANESISI